MHMSPSLCILHSYSTASGGSLPPGAGADHPGAGRGAGGAVAAPGGAAVRGATAGVRLRSGDHLRADS